MQRMLQAPKKNQKGERMIKLITFDEMLETLLTVEEKNERGKKMSATIIERRKLKDEAKRQAESFSSKIKLLDQQIEAEAVVIEDGIEWRKVRCTERLTASILEVEVVRCDTGEVIRTRPIRPEERQEDLFPANNQAVDDDQAVAESTENAAAFLGVNTETGAPDDLPPKNDYAARGANENGVYVEDDTQKAITFRSGIDYVEFTPIQDRVDGLWRVARRMQFCNAYSSYPCTVKSPASFTKIEAIKCEAIKTIQYLDGIKGKATETIQSLGKGIKGKTTESIQSADRIKGENEQRIEKLIKAIAYEDITKKEVSADTTSLDYPASQCAECAQIDGGHFEACSKRSLISFTTYLEYAKAQGLKNPNSHARKMELSRSRDAEVLDWIAEKQGKPEDGKLFQELGEKSQSKKTRTRRPKAYEDGL